MDSTLSPFLSIVTRCFRRPNLLARNVASVLNQTDQDLEHIFIVDEIGIGKEGANKSLALNKHLVNGQFVLILDDDDILVYDDYVHILKTLVRQYDPDVVITKMRWLSYGVVKPERRWWQRTPVDGHIGSPCFAVRREVWLKHIHTFGTPRGGDFYFIRTLWDEGYKFHWWNQVTVKILQIGDGVPEEEEVPLPEIEEEIYDTNIPSVYN